MTDHVHGGYEYRLQVYPRSRRFYFKIAALSLLGAGVCWVMMKVL